MSLRSFFPIDTNPGAVCTIITTTYLLYSRATMTTLTTTTITTRLYNSHASSQQYYLFPVTIRKPIAQDIGVISIANAYTILL